jgi:hypothetical protein
MSKFDEIMSALIIPLAIMAVVAIWWMWLVQR